MTAYSYSAFHEAHLGRGEPYVKGCHHCPDEAPAEPAPEPSREDRYEAAVRAVLDLCDRADTVPGDGVAAPEWLLDPDVVRETIARELRAEPVEEVPC